MYGFSLRRLGNLYTLKNMSGYTLHFADGGPTSQALVLGVFGEVCLTSRV